MRIVLTKDKIVIDCGEASFRDIEVLNSLIGRVQAAWQQTYGKETDEKLSQEIRHKGFMNGLT